MNCFKGILPIVFTALLGFPASAATLTTSYSYQTSCGDAATGQSSDMALTFSVAVGEGNCSSAISGNAAGGAVGINGTLNSTGAPTVFGHTLRVGATVSMSGIEITPSQGFTNQQLLSLYGRFIPIRVNSSVTGDLSALVTPDRGTQRSASANIEASAQLLTQQGSDLARGRANFGYNTNSGANGLSSFAQSLLPTVVADWSSTVIVRFNISGTAAVSSLRDANGFADFSAGNSLSFSTTGPAFILPDGFTVNAPEIGIFNNTWIDPRLPPVAAIPLPAGFPLLLAGLGTFALLRRRAGSGS